jgi:hypothetical protein
MPLHQLLGPYWEDSSHAVTRQTSAENHDGSHGGGARDIPDPSDPWLIHSGPAVQLGRGFKVRPYVPLSAGDTLVLAEIEGPGVITHLFLTTDARDLNQLRLRAYWDGAGDPLVDVPAGAFFGLGHPGRPHDIYSATIQVAPSRACSSYWPMPFSERARITLENEGPEDASIVAYRVAYEVGGAPHLLPRFRASWRQSTTNAAAPSHIVLPMTGGRGAYVGTSLYWTTRDPGWWGEGEVKFYLDGDCEFPTIVDNGTEDYAGGAWGFGRDDPHGGFAKRAERPFSGLYAGCPLVETDESGPRRISMYRWHVPDPIRFLRDVRVEVQALGWGDDRLYRVREDDVATVAYWYSWPS